jgi:hypothetical protein
MHGIPDYQNDNLIDFGLALDQNDGSVGIVSRASLRVLARILRIRSRRSHCRVDREKQFRKFERRTNTRFWTIWVKSLEGHIGRTNVLVFPYDKDGFSDEIFVLVQMNFWGLSEAAAGQGPAISMHATSAMRNFSIPEGLHRAWSVRQSFRNEGTTGEH